MACPRFCGVLTGAILLLVIGVLFLIMGGIVTSVVNKGIDDKIAESVSVGYNRSWDATDQAKFLCSTNDYDYYAFNITNLDQAMLGAAKFELRQTGPYYYREYAYRYNVTYDNNDDGETLSFNLWWQTLAKNDSGAYENNRGYEFSPITTVNPVYLNLVYGLRAQLGQLAPANETSTLAFLAGQGGIAGVYSFFTSTTSGAANFYTLARMLTVSSSLQTRGINASTLVTDFENVPGTSLSLGEAGVIFGVSQINFNTTAGIQAWYAAITEDPRLPKYKPLVVGVLTQALGSSTLANDTFNRVRFYLLNRVNFTNMESLTFTQLSGLPNLSEMGTNPSWTKLGLLQLGRSAYTLLSSSRSVDPNYNLTNSIYDRVYFGPEFANYGIVSNPNSIPVENITALFTIMTNATHLQNAGFYSATGQRYPPVSDAIGNTYNVSLFYRYFFQVIPSFVALESVVKFNGGLFTTRPAADISWGYPVSRPDPILAAIGSSFGGLSTTTANEADGFAKVPGRYKWYTGKGVPSSLASMYYAYRNVSSFSKVTDLWYSRSAADCNAIGDPTNCKMWATEEVLKGTSTTSYYGPGLDSDPNRVLKLWNPDTYRVINFTYSGPSNVKGIPAYKYEMAPDMLKNSTANPANAKYYMDVDGLAPISRAASNIPFHLSRPHLYGTYGDIQTRVSGLNVGLNDSEVRRLYWTEIDVEPKTGTAVSGNKKLQLNIRFQINDFVPYTRYSRMFAATGGQDIYLPLFWINQHNVANQTDADDAISNLDKIDKAKDIASTLRIVGFVVGSVLSAAGLALFFYYFKLRSTGGSTGTDQLKSSTELYVGK